MTPSRYYCSRHGHVWAVVDEYDDEGCPDLTWQKVRCTRCGSIRRLGRYQGMQMKKTDREERYATMKIEGRRRIRMLGICVCVWLMYSAYVKR